MHDLLRLIPPAIGVAVNPVAIVAAILMLGSPRPRLNGVAFTLGWVNGLLLVMIAPALLMHDRVSRAHRDPRPIVAVVDLAVGAAVLGMAAWAFFRRPDSDRPQEPRWLSRVGAFMPWQAAVLGAFLAIASLKNLALLGNAGARLGSLDLGGPALLLATAGFLLACSATVVVPLLMALFGGDGARATLDRLRDWLLTHMNRLTAVVLVPVGLSMLQSGMSGIR